jgi:hypothetical protein
MNKKSKIEKLNDQQSDYFEAVLSKEEFREFYEFLNLIKLEFNDFGIENGEFRAPSNSKFMIVETGFKYFTNIDFCIGDINELVRLLSRLDKKSKINVVIEENTIFFNDNYQDLKIGTCHPNYIDNKFVSEEEMEEKIYKNIDKHKPLMNEILPQSIVSNIYKTADDLNTPTISVKHEKGNLSKGYISVANQGSSKDSSDLTAREYSIRLKRAFLRPMEMNHYFVLNTSAFVFSKHDMNINCFISKDNRMITTIYTVVVRNLLINIYCRGTYMECDE